MISSLCFSFSLIPFEGLAGQLKPELEIHAYCKLVLLPGGKTQNSIVRRGRDVVFNQVTLFLVIR